MATLRAQLVRVRVHPGNAGLADAAKQRNVLVHMYLEIDDRKVFASLDRLDDLREFAAAVQKLIDRDQPNS